MSLCGSARNPGPKLTARTTSLLRLRLAIFWVSLEGVHVVSEIYLFGFGDQVEQFASLRILENHEDVRGRVDEFVQLDDVRVVEELQDL